MSKLDLTKFPEFENVNGLLKYDVFKEFKDLDKLGEISERIYGCCEFISGKSDEKYPFYIETVFLRAFLNEFASLNEILKNSSFEKFRNLSIEQTDYPLFHFLKLLRNVNFHVRSFTIGTKEYQAQLYNKVTKEVYGEVMTLTRFIIDELDINLIQQARDYKHYDIQDLNYIIEWFDYHQKSEGVNSILEETLRQYCKLLQKYCG